MDIKKQLVCIRLIGLIENHGHAIFKNVFTSPLGRIVSLDESRIKEGMIIVGTDDGLVQITKDNGVSWRKFENFPGIPSRAYVTDVVASKHDVNTIYVTFNYHKYGDYKNYLVAIIVPNKEEALIWAKENNKSEDLSNLIEDESFIKIITPYRFFILKTVKIIINII